MGYAKIGSSAGDERQEQVAGIDVTVALFFDGTGNNKDNTDERKKANATYQDNTDHRSSSYENDYSNVARLSANYADGQINVTMK